MKEYIVSDAEAGGRLDKYLAKLLPDAPQNLLYKSLRKKNITLCDGRAEGNKILKAGDRIRLYFSDDTINKFSGHSSFASDDGIADNPLCRYIIYEDSSLLVINKPAGMLSQKDRHGQLSLCEYIKAYLRDGNSAFTAGVANRLDRNTSGVIVSGKTLTAQQALSKSFRDRTAEKYYIAVVRGHISDETVFEGYITKNTASNTVSISRTAKEGAEYIKTVISSVGTSGDFSLLKIRLVTGKTHQIRATLKTLGLPIAGDAKYGFCADGIKRQMLHAYSISFPRDFEITDAAGKTFIAPLPEDIKYALRYFGLDKYGF